MSESGIELRPIGVVSCSRTAAVDDDWDAERSEIHFDAARVGPEATLGLDDFSQVEVIFLFHGVD